MFITITMIFNSVINKEGEDASWEVGGIKQGDFGLLLEYKPESRAQRAHARVWG
jgi:hypothetical protein